MAQRSTLKIGGQVIDRPGRRVLLNRLRLSLDEPDSLDFCEIARGTASRWTRGTAVELAIDDMPYFAGRINSSHLAPRGDKGYATGYRAQGLKYWANKAVTITNPGSPPGILRYNLRRRDPDWIASNAGLSVGEILRRVLDLHAPQLAAAGIAGYVAEDLGLEALGQRPPEPVYLSGKLFNAIAALLDAGPAIVSCLVRWEPDSGDWRIRFLDTSRLEDVVRVYGVELLERPELDLDVSTCASRVLARGVGHLAGAVLSLSAGSLVEHFETTAYPTNAAAKAAWTIAAFDTPDGAADQGDIIAQTGNSITIRSDYAAAHWPDGYWTGETLAYVYLEDVTSSAGASLTQQVSFVITDNSALAAGATCTITWDSTEPAPGTGFTRYRIVGQPTDGLNGVYRRYRIANRAIAAALVPYSEQAIPLAGMNFEQGMHYPAGWVVYSDPTGNTPGRERPLTFRIDPANQDIVFDVPVVRLEGTDANLQAGGSRVDGIPDDVRVFVIFKQYDLAEPYPPDDASGFPQHAGTCYTRDGYAHTEILELGDGWSTEGGRADAAKLAQVKHATLCDTVITGNVTVEGLDLPMLRLGKRLSLEGAGMPEAWATLRAPIRSVELAYAAGPGPLWRTTLQLNNQRRQATGDRGFTHPMFTGQNLLMGDSSLVERQQGLMGSGVGQLGPVGFAGGGMRGSWADQLAGWNADAAGQLAGGMDAAAGQVGAGQDAAAGEILGAGQDVLDGMAEWSDPDGW